MPDTAMALGCYRLSSANALSSFTSAASRSAISKWLNLAYVTKGAGLEKKNGEYSWLSRFGFKALVELICRQSLDALVKLVCVLSIPRGSNLISPFTTLFRGSKPMR